MVRDHSGRATWRFPRTSSCAIFVGSRKENRTYDVEIRLVAVPTDAASIAKGKHYVEAVGVCQVCHGQNLAGPNVDECKVVPCTGFSDDPLFGKLMPIN